MQVIADKKAVNAPSWLGRLFAKSSAQMSAEHTCSAPDQNVPVKTTTVPCARTYVCCECGQHWRNNSKI